ncbi:MAG TPA: MarR family transcriptional regulator [Bryobacteraceae bacterium]|jgi:DNA-binding MarR family transcriptional regulator|nr:MarR family transcriptional regulator [Bryobacteraceae bacterium]
MSSRKRAELIQTVGTEVRRFLAGGIFFNLKVAEDIGINATDLQCLNVLELQGSATPTELAGWSRLTTGGITVVLDRLEKAGFIRRDPNPKDRRSTIIRPVMPAFAKLETIYRSKAEGLAKALSCYNNSELETIVDFFVKTNTAGAEEKG